MSCSTSIDDSKDRICEQYKKYYYYDNGHLYRKEDNKRMGSLIPRGYLIFHDKYWIEPILGNKDSCTKMVARIIYIITVGPIPANYQVDHIDRNRLNNLSSNLRAASASENVRNQDWSNKRSRYVGVAWNLNSGKWAAQIWINKRTKYLGVFKKEEDAAIAYNNFVIKNKLDRTLNTFE